MGRLKKWIYSNLRSMTPRSPIRRRVRQEDTISPWALEDIVNSVDCQEDRNNIDGTRLNPLRFIDDIFLINNFPEELDELMKFNKHYLKRDEK